MLERAGERLADGLRIRCRVSVDFYPPGGRLQVQIREIDPTFTLGDLAQRRQETLQALAEAGLLERNRALPLPALPMSIALVTSTGSAAYHDFLATLRESGYAFRVFAVHSAVQGAEAERSLPSALALAAATDCDCIVLIRGGGSKSDLAVFDSQAVAEAVARAAKPVLTGLGHEIDESVADLVAHQSFKTPTKVAEELVARIATAELAVARLREQMTRQARLAIAEAGRSSGARRAPRGRRPGTAGPGLAAARRARLKACGASRCIACGPPTSSSRAGARLVGELSPARTLRRGFSITRDAAGPCSCATRPRSPPGRRSRASSPWGCCTAGSNPATASVRRACGRGEGMSQKRADREVGAEDEAEVEPGFTAAMRELETILQRIEGDELDIDRLAEELKRATALLELCRGKIRRAELEVTEIVQKLEQS